MAWLNMIHSPVSRTQSQDCLTDFGKFHCTHYSDLEQKCCFCNCYKSNHFQDSSWHCNIPEERRKVSLILELFPCTTNPTSEIHTWLQLCMTTDVPQMNNCSKHRPRASGTDLSNYTNSCCQKSSVVDSTDLHIRQHLPGYSLH